MPEWTDVAGLNYDNPALREYMIAMLKYWIKEADVDGFRCDVASMVPTDFWEQVRDELDQGQAGHHDARRSQQTRTAREGV